MIPLEDFASKELERIQYDFESQDIEVKCLKNMEDLELIGEKTIRLRKGSVIRIPFWLALILEKEGCVEIEMDMTMDIPQLHRMSDNEQENPPLQKMNTFFYILAKNSLQELKTGNNFSSFKKKETIITNLSVLMRQRLNKIIKIAAKGKDITTTTRNMTPEESWLFEIVSDAIEKWKDIVTIKEI